MIDITLRKIVKFSFKLKQQLHKLLTASIPSFIFLMIWSTTSAQSPDSLISQLPVDSNIVPESVIPDTLNSNKKENSDIEYTINYNAVDSMWFDVKTQKVILYGDAHADYGDITVEAEHIEIDWTQQLITATYTLDSNGNKIGIPVFKDKQDEYTADTIAYNVKTKKGYISKIYTQQNNDHIKSDRVYKDEYNNVFMEDATYCPCDDKDATTYIKTKKLKVIPEKRVYSGPALLHIGNIPTPLGMPFAIFPITNQKTSGIIIPDFNYSELRGYYLTNGGFYWATNDYVGIKFLGSIYSNGGGALGISSNYKYRYHYNGSLFLNYTKEVQNGDEYARQDIKNYSLRWNHTPQTTSGRKLTANVELASSQYNFRNEIDATVGLKNTMTSNIRYTMPMTGTPFSSSISLRHFQNNATKIYDFTLPNYALNMNRIYPLRRNSTTKDYSFEPLNVIRDFYQSTSIAMSSNIKYDVSNKPLTKPSLPFEISNFNESNLDTLLLEKQYIASILDRAKLNMSYSIPVQATLKVAKGKIAITPRFNYSGYVYPESYSFKADSVADDDGIYSEAFRMDTTHALAHAYKYSTSVSTNTNIYGIYKFTKPGLPKFLHTVTPTVGMTFAPEFSDYEKYSQNYSKVYSTAADTSYYISKYLGYTLPTGSKQSSLSFSLNNTLQMKSTKVKEVNDTSDTKKTSTPPISIIKMFRLSSSYNFAAEEFNLSTIKLDANTSILKSFININYSNYIDPYTLSFDSTASNYQERSNTYAWDNNQGIGNLTYQSIILSTNSISPQSIKKLFQKEPKLEPETEDSIATTPSLYPKLEKALIK